MRNSKHFHFILTILSSLLVIPLISIDPFAQQILGEMEIEPVTKLGMYINPYSDKAALIVHSNIANLCFATNNRGILEQKQIETGVYQIKLYPGTHIITYSTIDNSFKAIDDRIYIEAGKVGERQVRVVKNPGGGRGSIFIESEPPGAVVKFNNLLAGTTPLTLLDQPTGNPSIRLEHQGYSPLDSVVKIERDSITSYRFTMKKNPQTSNISTYQPYKRTMMDLKMPVPVFAFSIGMGQSYGCFGVSGQIYPTSILGLHAGVGYFPASVSFPEYDFVDDAVLAGLGLRIYPLDREPIYPFIDFQYGGLGVAAQEVYYYDGWTSYTETEQEVLVGPSVLLGGELRFRMSDVISGGLLGALGLSFITNDIDWYDQKVFLTIDLGGTIYFNKP